MSSLVVNVVADDEVVTGCRRAVLDAVVKVVFGVLNQGRRIIVVIIGIDIKVGDVVSKLGHIILAARRGSTIRIWWAHVGGEEAKNVSQRHLVAPHVLFPLLAGEVAKIGVGPGVTSNLVAFVVSTLNDRVPAVGSVVNLALAVVVSGDEEGGLRAVLLEDIKNVAGVNVWAIVECDGDGPCHSAVVDAGTAIRNVTVLWPSNS